MLESESSTDEELKQKILKERRKKSNKKYRVKMKKPKYNNELKACKLTETVANIEVENIENFELLNDNINHTDLVTCEKKK